MIVPVRNWTLLRPMRVAMRARKVQKSNAVEVREAKPKRGVVHEFESMLTHAADLMIRGYEE